MILDAQSLLQFFDSGAESHWSARGRIEMAAEYDELVVSPFVIAELEPIVREKFGLQGWLAVLDELAGGAWTIAMVDAPHLAAMREEIADGETSAGASVAALTAGPSRG